MAKRILRPAESQARLGVGHTKFYELIKTGRLAPPLELGPKSVGHLESEIDQLIDTLVAERNERINRREPTTSGKLPRVAGRLSKRRNNRNNAHAAPRGKHALRR